MSNADRDVLIIQRLNQSFNQYPQTSDNKDLFAELFGNLRDSAAEKMAAGKSAEEAVAAAFQEFGDVDELLQQVNAEDGTAVNAAEQPAAPTAPQAPPAPSAPAQPTPLPNAQGRSPQPAPVPPAHGKTAPAPIGTGIHRDPRLVEVQHLGAPAHGISALAVTYPDDVELQPIDGDQFTLMEYMTTDEPNMYARMAVQGGTLTVQAGRRSHFSFTFRINQLSWGFHALLVIGVPRGFSGSVTVDGDDGNVAIHDLGTLADVAVKLDDGNLHLANVSGDELDVESGDGNVILAAASFPQTSLSADDGNIKLDHFQAADELSVESGDGNIILNTVNAGSLSVSGDDGNQNWTVVHAGDVTVSFSDGHWNASDMTAASLDLSFDDGNAAIRRSTIDQPVTASYEDGSLTLEQFTGAGDFTAEDGRFAASFTAVTGNVNVSGEDGSTRLELPVGASYYFNLRREDGRVSVPDEAVFSKQGHHRWQGSVGTAPAFTVTVNKEDGSISIR